MIGVKGSSKNLPLGNTSSRERRQRRRIISRRTIIFPVAINSPYQECSTGFSIYVFWKSHRPIPVKLHWTRFAEIPRIGD